MVPSAGVARVAIVAVSLLLVWRVIQVNAVSYEDSGRPRLPGLPAAIEASPSERQVVELSALRRMLAENPAEVAALLMLAQEAEVAGDAARATRAYRTALTLAPLERRVLTLAGLHFLRQGDSRGVEILASLSSQYPAARPQAFPILAQTLASGRHQAAWAQIVARSPGWLGGFVADACTRGVEPAVLAPVLLARPDAGGAAAAGAACVIDRLRSEDRWEEAYHLWLGVLPRDRLANVGFVFNGNFESSPSGIGFDWIAAQGAEKDTGHVAEVALTPSLPGKRALRVAYNGKRQSGVPIRQFMALPSGDFTLVGLARTEGIKALRGIHWTVRCVEKGKPLSVIASSERFLGSGEWRPFSVEVHVPDSCPGQVLQLEPVGDDGAVAFVSGTAWFDNFVMRRQ